MNLDDEESQDTVLSYAKDSSRSLPCAELDSSPRLVGAQNDMERRAQNDNWMLLNALFLMNLADRLDFATIAVILGK
jgi:hypothetical protein